MICMASDSVAIHCVDILCILSHCLQFSSREAKLIVPLKWAIPFFLYRGMESNFLNSLLGPDKNSNSRGWHQKSP